MTTFFQESGRFFKGNLHTHSTQSDGRESPEQVIEAYRSRGYQFIALTDHFLPARRWRDSDDPARVTDTTHLRDTDFTTLLGAELHAPELKTGDAWHIVAAGLPLDFDPVAKSESGIDLARRASETGAFVGIAHPAWYALTIEDAETIAPYCQSIEIYNHGCTIHGREDSWHFADAMFARGHKLSAYAADDAHFKDPRGSYGDAFGGWVQVKAPSFDPDAILAALKAGHFYSSTGPEIEDISFDGEVLRVRTSPAFTYFLNGVGARFARTHGDGMTEGDFPLRNAQGELHSWAAGRFVRFTMFDNNMKRAWSNPIWLDGR